MVRAHECAHESRCGRLRLKVRKRRCAMSWMYRSAVAKLNHRAVDRVCPKSVSCAGVKEWLRLTRVAKFVRGRPDTGIMFACRAAPSQLTVQCDSDWVVRLDQHLLRSWSNDQTVIALSSREADLYAAC